MSSFFFAVSMLCCAVPLPLPYRALQRFAVTMLCCAMRCRCSTAPYSALPLPRIAARCHCIATLRHAVAKLCETVPMLCDAVPLPCHTPLRHAVSVLRSAVPNYALASHCRSLPLRHNTNHCYAVAKPRVAKPCRYSAMQYLRVAILCFAIALPHSAAPCHCYVELCVAVALHHITPRRVAVALRRVTSPSHRIAHLPIGRHRQLRRHLDHTVSRDVRHACRVSDTP